MPVLTVVVFSVAGLGLFAALSAALYSSLPRSFLESAERHGRFQGLNRDEPVVGGKPADVMPEGNLSGQTA